MRTRKEIVEQAKRLSAAERQKLIEELEQLDRPVISQAARRKALRDFLKMGGKGNSGRSDISSNKQKYFAEAMLNKKIHKER